MTRGPCDERCVPAWRAVCVSVITCTFLAGCMSIAQRAERSLERGDTTRALELADRASVQHPSEAGPRVIAARAHLNAGALDDAGRETDLAIALNPDLVDAWIVTFLVALETQDRRRAAESYIALQARGAADHHEVVAGVTSADLDFVSAAFPELLRLDFEAARSWADRWSSRADAPPDLTRRIVVAIDYHAYQLLYGSRGVETESLLGAFEPWLDGTSVTAKHRALLAIEQGGQGGQEGPSMIEALVGDDNDLLDALAFEFAARRANQSALVAYTILAERTDGDTASDAWRAAAAAAYDWGRRGTARANLEQSIGVARAPLVAISEAHRLASHRGDTSFAAELLQTHGDVPCPVEPHREDRLIELELAITRAAITDDAGQARAQADRILDRARECDSIAMLSRSGDALVEMGYGEAGLVVFIEALARDPSDGDVASRAIVAAERAGAADVGVEIAQDFVRRAINAVRTQDAPSSVVADALRVVESGRSAEMVSVRIVLLEELFGHAPDGAGLAIRLADAHVSAGDTDAAVEVLATYRARSEDPLRAAYETGRWLARRDGAAVAAMDVLLEVAAAPEARRMSAQASNEEVSIAEAAYSQVLNLARRNSDEMRLFVALRGLADVLGPDARETWGRLWSEPYVVGSLGPPALRWLIDASVDAGYESAQLYTEAGNLLSRDRNDEAAVDAYIRAMDLAPAGSSAVVDAILRSPRPELAVPLIEHLLRTRGEDADRLATLAQIYGSLARVSVDYERREAYTGAARAYTIRALEAGYPAQQLDAASLRSMGMVDLAARVGEARFAAGANTPSNRATLALDMLDAGYDEARVRELLSPGLDEATPSLRRDVVHGLATRHHTSWVAELAPRWIVAPSSEGPERQLASRRELVDLLAVASDRDTYRDLVHEMWVEPARRLAEPFSELPAGYANVRDRRAWGAQLLEGAAFAYARRGLHADTLIAAEEAAQAGSTSREILLALALHAARASMDGRLDARTVDRLIGASGGTYGDWISAGRILGRLGELEVAELAYGRAAARGSFSWEIELERIVLLVRLGRTDEIVRSIDGLFEVFDAAGATANDLDALYFSVAGPLRASGHLDLLETIANACLARDQSITAIQLDLARLEGGRGAYGSALRRAESAMAGQRTGVVEALVDAGWELAALRRWDLIAGELGPGDSFGLRLDVGVRFTELLGLHALEGIIGRTVSFDSDFAPRWLAWELSTAGHNERAVVQMLRAAAAVSRDDWVLALGMALAEQNDDLARRVLERLAGEEFENASFDPELPFEAMIALALQFDGDELILDTFVASVDGDTATREDGVSALLLWEMITGDLGTMLDRFDAAQRRPERIPASGFEDGARARHDRVRAHTISQLRAVGLNAEASALLDRERTDGRTIDPFLMARIHDAHPDEERESNALAVYIDASGGHAPLLLPLAPLLVHGGEPQRAIDFLAPLVSGGTAPVAADALRAMIPAAEVLDDHEPVRRALDVLIRRFGLRFVANERIHLALSRARMDAIAIDLLERVIRDGTDADTWLEDLVVVAYRAGHFDDATRHLDRLVATASSPTESLDTVTRRLSPYEAPWVLRYAAELEGALRPSAMQTRSRMLRALEFTGDHAGAERATVELWRELGEHPEIAAQLIELTSGPGLGASALALAREAVNGERMSVRLALAAARAASRHDATLVQRALARGLAIAPEPALFHVDAATIYLESGLADDAWDAATQALLDLPDAPAARRVRIHAAIERGTIEEALAEIDRWLDVEAAPLAGLSEVHARLLNARDFSAARMVADRMARVHASRMQVITAAWPGSPGLDAAVRSYAAHAPHEGVLWLESHHPRVAMYPERAGLLVSVAHLYEAAGQIDTAVEAYARGLAADPDNLAILNNLSYLYAYHEREIDDAERLARRALALDRRINANTIDTLGWVLYRQGRYAEAEALVRRALRVLPALALDDPSEAARVLREHVETIAAARAATSEHSAGTETRHERRERRTVERQERREIRALERERRRRAR